MLTIKLKRIDSKQFKVYLYLGEKLVEQRVVQASKPFEVLDKIGFTIKYHRITREYVE